MDIYELVAYRRSVREWSDRTIEEPVLTRILDAARLAPSAKNRQEWYVVVVRDEKTRRALGTECARQPFVGEAPVVLVICGDPSVGIMRCGMPRMPMDTAILIDHITLLAASEGLGTCWIGSFDADMAAELVSLPTGWVVAQLLPIGYPQDPHRFDKERKSFRDVVGYERWGGRAE